jgi:hypothetical protein
MSPLEVCHLLMTTKAESVDRFFEHKRHFAGMGVMAYGTASAEDDTMDIRHRIFFIKQPLFITVTEDTQVK